MMYAEGKIEGLGRPAATDWRRLSCARSTPCATLGFETTGRAVYSAYCHINRVCRDRRSRQTTQTDRQKRQSDRQIERQTDETDRYADRQTDHADRPNRQTHRQIEKTAAYSSGEYY